MIGHFKLVFTRLLVASVLVQGASALAAPLEGPIKIVVTFGPGSGADLLARTIAARLAEKAQVPVIVENKDGAGGNIGASSLSRSAPDGKTLMVTTPGPLTTNQFLYKKLPFDPSRDFAPVILLGTFPNILVSSMQSGIKTLDDLRAAARASGGLAYATAGVGTTTHLAGELLAREAGIKLLHVPYKTATAYVSDLLGGQIPIALLAQSAVELIKNGRLNAIAVTSSSRSAALPEVPTLSELGVKGFNAEAWYGLIAPRDTPRSTVEILNKLVSEILMEKEFRDFAHAQLLTVRPNSPQEFSQFIQAERDKWQKVIEGAGLHLD